MQPNSMMKKSTEGGREHRGREGAERVGGSTEGGREHRGWEGAEREGGRGGEEGGEREQH